MSYVKKLSFSMMVDETPCQKIKRNITSWVSDDAVDKCYGCQIYFTMFIRKHHCRGCGRIFCYQCSNCTIPSTKLQENNLISKEEYLETCMDNTIAKDYHRSCLNCKQEFNRLYITATKINAFKLIPIEINHLFKCLYVNKSWHECIIYYINKFRNIQYNLPFHKFALFEKRVLFYNLNNIIGHSKYMCQFIKSINYDVITNDELLYILKTFELVKKPRTCKEMMCGRNCKPILQYEDVIDIIMCVYHPLIRKYCFKYFTKEADKILCFVPILTYCIRHDYINEDIVTNIMICHSLKDIRIRNRFYWELIVQLKQSNFNDKYVSALNKYKRTITEKLGEDELFKIVDGENFDKIMKISAQSTNLEINNIIRQNIKEHNLDKRNVYLPINPNYQIVHIIDSKISVKNSATKPIQVPCMCKNKDGQTELYEVIYKSEDVRKDNLIMNIIRIIDLVLKDEEEIDFDILTYDILPTTLNSGFIEIVKNADTLYNIKEKRKKSILNYVLEKNPLSTVGFVRDRLMKSTAAYCVITYMLGIGDRHLDNIMVSSDARLFHIDYGYILGSDPKPFSPYIRITPEMIEAIGGENSEMYVEFQRLCSVCYNCLRRHPSLIMNMLYLLTDDVKKLEAEINARFIPGESYKEAELQFITKMNSGSVSNHVIDFFHFHNKEDTVRKAWSYASSLYKKIDFQNH